MSRRRTLLLITSLVLFGCQERQDQGKQADGTTTTTSTTATSTTTTSTTPTPPPTVSADGSLACAAAADEVWTTPTGSAGCDVTVEYWSSGACRASFDPVGGKATGAEPQPATGAKHATATYTGTNGLRFHCTGDSSGGNCSFALTNVSKTGMTGPTPKTVSPVRAKCGDHNSHELYDGNGLKCTVTVTATAPDGCTAEVWEDGSSHRETVKAGHFVTLPDVTKVLVECKGDGKGECVFTPRITCPTP